MTTAHHMPLLGGLRRCVAPALIALALSATPLPAVEDVLLTDNAAELHAVLPTEACRMADSNQPGALYLPGEKAEITLVIPKGTGPYVLELQEVGTRLPESISTDKNSVADFGFAPKFHLIGKPVRVDIAPAFGDQPSLTMRWNAPLSERFGTYAVVLEDGGKRTMMGTIARVLPRRTDSTVEGTPIFGEGQFMTGSPETLAKHAEQYARIGIRGWRSELGWNEQEDGTTDWTAYDALFALAEKYGCKIMVTLGGTSANWSRPFPKEPTPAVNWAPDCGGYWGRGDWLMDARHYERYGKWIEAFCRRYWKEGKGGLWGIENYNEPWEGGGISGWARDMLQYRKLQETIATAARSVSPDIRILAASSIMNTEDKLFSDGKDTMAKHIDIFTDHYVPPRNCYGPLVAKRWGKESMESETWFVRGEFQLPQAVSQFMACGQKRISPFHPRDLFGAIPGGEVAGLPAPSVVAIAAFNHFVSDKPFQRMVFKEHLPWAFQFGADDDKDALIVLFGKLIGVASNSTRDMPWAQIEAAAGGEMEIDNADGLLQFYDMAGNPDRVGEHTVRLPMTIYPSYIRSAKGPLEVAKRLAAAKITGKQPVEILPRDPVMRIADGASFTVSVANRLNRPVKGTLSVTAPAGIILANAVQAVELGAGESRMLNVTMAKAQANAGNTYPFAFAFDSDAGRAAYTEALSAAIAVKGTKQIDGDLGDWKDIPAINVVSKGVSLALDEAMRRPWLAAQEAKPDAVVAEVRFAWDADNLYVAARVKDATPDLDKKSFVETTMKNPDWFFHSAESDQETPYKEFLEKNKGQHANSFAEVSYIQKRSPELFAPYRRDRLHLAIDVDSDQAKNWHDLTPDLDRVPLGFHAYPDSDYEYALYAVAGGGSECFRLMAPGVPRVHGWPRQPQGDTWIGAVAGARHVVKYDAASQTYTYELAIPKSELKNLELQNGTTFGLSLRIGDQNNNNADYGPTKAVTKENGLTMHPYWEPHASAGSRFGLVE